MNNELMLFQDDISMTTVEIADLTGKRHDHVMRDAKVMLVELYGEKSLPKFGESYIADNRRVYYCYRLPQEEVLGLISGYSIKLRMKIIRRLKLLEGQRQASLPDFSNQAEAARAYGDQF